MRSKAVFAVLLFFCTDLSAQSPEHIYHVNRLVTGGITAGTSLASLGGFLIVNGKSEIADTEFTHLDKSAVNSFDRWVIEQEILSYPKMSETYAIGMMTFAALLPLGLAFDSRMKSDRWDLFLMYLETNAISLAIYEVSPLGPLFNDRYRPICYSENLTYEQRKDAYNRNSFYSGHTAAVAAQMMFCAKVYSDYHPELGAYKYALFGAALISPLLMGYIRIRQLLHFPSDVLLGLGLGTLCGILIPEIHRLAQRSITAASPSSVTSHGINIGIAYQKENWSFFLR